MVDLDDELENWARLVRVGRITHFCGSAEKYYRAPAAENLETNERTDNAVPLRVRDGWAVEFAWRQLPTLQVRLLVSMVYVRNRHPAEAARRLRLQRHKADQMLSQARHEMKARLLTEKGR